jgi:hypothetical protein
MHLPGGTIQFITPLLALGLFAPNGTAQAIKLSNPSFELPAFAAPNGGYPADPNAYGNATSWVDGYYTGTGTSWTIGAASAGAINPGPIGYGYKGVARTGQQVGYTATYNGYGQGMAQILTVSLKPNTHYDLKGFVGNPVAYNGTSKVNYRMELLAAGTLLASTSGSVTADTWTPVHVSYTSGATATGTLEIRLVAPDSGTTDLEINWEDISLMSCAAAASQSNYGAGLKGKNGVPGIRLSAAPKFGASVSLQAANSSGATAAGMIVIGVSSLTVPFLGGTLLVAPLEIVSVSVPSAGLSLPFKIPAACTVAFYLQTLQLDSAAVAGVSMSEGLKLQFGL